MLSAPTIIKRAPKANLAAPKVDKVNIGHDRQCRHISPSVSPESRLSVAPEKPVRKKTYNEEGYVRIWYGPDRGKYEHRIVMRDVLQKERICADHVFPLIDPKSGLPYGMVVHHIDGIRDNNEGPNLMLMDAAIHDAISPCMTKNGREKRLSSRLCSPTSLEIYEADERAPIQNENGGPMLDVTLFWAEAMESDLPKRKLAASIKKSRKRSLTAG